MVNGSLILVNRKLRERSRSEAAAKGDFYGLAVVCPLRIIFWKPVS